MATTGQQTQLVGQQDANVVGGRAGSGTGISISTKTAAVTPMVSYASKLKGNVVAEAAASTATSISLIAAASSSSATNTTTTSSMAVTTENDKKCAGSSSSTVGGSGGHDEGDGRADVQQTCSAGPNNSASDMDTPADANPTKATRTDIAAAATTSEDGAALTNTEGAAGTVGEERSEASILPVSSSLLPPPTSSSLSAKDSQDVGDQVDSALLAALRDPRERLGLLKFEQVVVDFLQKQPQDPYIDVGGPYNSTVVSPSLGFLNPSSFIVSSQSSSTKATTIITLSAGNATHGESQSNDNDNNKHNKDEVFDEVAYQNLITNGNRFQTTFHKCLVHRLGDRFGLARERAYNAEGTYYNNQYIRLCKTPQSKFPPRRLLEIPQAEYYASGALQSSMQQMTISSVGRFFGADAAAEIAGDRVSSIRRPQTVAGVCDGETTSTATSATGGIPAPGNSNIVTSGGNVTNNPPTKSKPRKMVIMKRNSSNVSDGGSSGGIGPSGKNKAKTGKSDSSSSSSSSSKAVNSKDSLSEKEKKYAEARARIFQQDQSDDADGDGGGGETSNDASNDISTTAQDSTDTNQASSGTTKATYRNKQQEESDPDFRRGVGVLSRKGAKAGRHNTRSVPTSASSSTAPAAAAAPSTASYLPNHPGLVHPSAASYAPGSGYFVAPISSMPVTAAGAAAAAASRTATPIYYYQGLQGEYYTYDPNAYSNHAYGVSTVASTTTTSGCENVGTGYIMPNPVYPSYGVPMHHGHWQQQQQQPYQYDASYKGNNKTKARNKKGVNGGDGIDHR